VRRDMDELNTNEYEALLYLQNASRPQVTDNTTLHVATRQNIANSRKRANGVSSQQKDAAY